MDGGSESQTTTVDYPAWLREYIDPLLESGATAFSEGPPAVYPYQTYAGFTPEQTQGQEFALNFADQFSDMYSPAMGAYTRAMSGTNPYAQYMEDGNPYLDEMVGRAQQSVADVFNTSVMGNIRDEAIAAGQPIGAGYSTYSKGVDMGTENLLENMGDIATSMYGSAYETDMNRLLAGEQLGMDAMMKGLSLTPQMFSTAMMPGQLYSAVGAERQGMDQNAINQAIQNWYYPYTSNLQHLQDFSSLFTGLSPGGTTQSTMDNASNPWAQAIGSGAMGAGMAQMMGWNPWLMGGAMALPYIWQ